MPALSEVLSAFARAIVRGEPPSPQIAASCLNYSVDVAIEVYRNNYRGNLHDALADAYPVIKQLVGDDFFRLLARKFIEQHPSRNGNLHHYGAEMASFLRTFEPAQGLAYLPDIAALEWACHRAYFADDTVTPGIGKLVQVPAEQYAGLILRTHPACYLVRSPYPIAAIWHAHQPDAPNDFHIELDGGRCNALVSRKKGIVEVSELPDADAAWLQSIQSGAALGAATDAALARHAGFDLQSLLLRLLQRDILVD